MPKMKTVSGAKRRFKLSATGKVVRQSSGKRHGMIKKSPKQIRNLRGTTLVSKADTKLVKRHYMVKCG